MKKNINITNISFLTVLSTQQFTILTKKNKYQCNIYGVKPSAVISKHIKNNSPQVFKYDYEDDSGEFKLICDYFNFKNVTLKMKSIDMIKDISEDLQISPLIKEIDLFLNK